MNALSPCTAGETRILVNLGTLNTRESKPAVSMNHYLTKYPYSLYPEAIFSVEISGVGATGSTDLIPLPVLNNVTNYQHVFMTTDLDSVQLISSVLKANINAPEDEYIGGAVAILAELKRGLGPERDNLIRNNTIPVLDRGSLKPVGAIPFDFCVW